MEVINHIKMTIANKAKFELLGKPLEVLGDSGNVYIVSQQRITQENGTFSDHVVINKIRRNVDGTQNERGKQLFIAIKSLPQVIDALQNLVLKK